MTRSGLEVAHLFWLSESWPYTAKRQKLVPCWPLGRRKPASSIVDSRRAGTRGWSFHPRWKDRIWKVKITLLIGKFFALPVDTLWRTCPIPKLLGLLLAQYCLVYSIMIGYHLILSSTDLRKYDFIFCA